MGTEGDPGPTGTDSGEGQGSQSENSLGNDFLAKIPEADRPVVEKYIKDWDAGVTTKFQEIHNQYAPYKELGEVENLRNATQLMEYINDQPDAFLEQLAKELGVEIPNKEAPKPPTGTSSKGDLQGLPEEFMSEFQQTKTMLDSLAKAFVAKEQRSEEEAQVQQLNSYLDHLKETLGEFDVDSVLAKMARGVDGEQAAKEWIKLYGKPAPPIPPNVLGAGGLPSGQGQSIANLDKKSTVSLVAQMLAANNQQG